VKFSKKAEEKSEEIGDAHLDSLVNYFGRGVKGYVDPMPVNDDFDSCSKISEDSIIDTYLEPKPHKEPDFRPSTQNVQLRIRSNSL